MPVNESGLYVFDDVAFVNTSLFTEAARHFKQHKKFTLAPRGHREYDEFWDREEDRLKNGMTASGKLLTDKKGRVSMQEVHITGKHYGFLNYARILRTEDDAHTKPVRGALGSTLRKKKTIEFPDFIDGQYHYFQAKQYAEDIAKNLAVSKARRKGFSYMEGWDSALDINMIPFISILVCAYDLKYITKGNQMMGMAKKYLDFLELNTDFNRGFLKEDKEWIKLGYKKKEEGNKEFGFLSEIMALSFGNNPDAAIGKDAYKIKMEECGRFRNLKEALGTMISTTEDGAETTGNVTMFGVVGSGEENWQDFEEIFYEPAKYNCLAFDNVWDDGATGNGVGFYYAQDVGYAPFIDKHGNSLREAARQDIFLKREVKKRSLTPSEYLVYVSQRGLCPKESFASSGDNIFPVAEISDQLNRVLHDKDIKYLPRVGQLINTDKGIRFKFNEVLREEGIKIHDVIDDFPLKSGVDVYGAYREWFSPFRDKATMTIPKGLYRIWVDPYATDKDTKDIVVKNSLGSAYVYERVNNMSVLKGDVLVAELVGRPERMNEFNDSLFKMAKYWNAEIFFESNRGNIKDYAVTHRSLDLLANEPDFEWDIQLKGTKKVRGKGMTMNEARKNKGVLYLRDWLLQPRSTDANGNVKVNLHYIYSAGLLRELLKWNSKGNFDRVSSLILGMFDVQECFNKEIKVATKASGDDFFNRKLFTN